MGLVLLIIWLGSSAWNLSYKKKDKHNSCLYSIHLPKKLIRANKNMSFQMWISFDIQKKMKSKRQKSPKIELHRYLNSPTS